MVVRPAGGGSRKDLAAQFRRAARAVVGEHHSSGDDEGADALVDIVLDGIGGPTLEASVDVLDRGGRLVHFGGSTFMTPGAQDHTHLWEGNPAHAHAQ